jgi:endonuclease YncB( thermonuclease family)
LRRARRFGWAGLLFVAAAWWLDATVGADLPAESAAALPPGAVERVIDGDTLRVVQADGSALTLRLLGVDAPESGQAGGAEAREFVATRVCAGEVTWRSHGSDRYGRTVASVEVAGEDLGVLLVRNGLAWRVKRYLEAAPADLREAHEAAWQAARAERIGLWAGDPQPPWEWRRTNQPAKGQSIPCADRR